MKYFTNRELFDWVEKRQKTGFRGTVLLIVLFLFMGAGMYFDSKEEFNNRFLFGVIGELFLMLFLTYNYINSLTIINKTIKEIEISETSIVLKTFPCYILGKQIMKEKIISKEFHSVNFSSAEYPLKDKNKNFETTCSKFKIREIEYYLLNGYFDNDLMNVLKRIISKK